MSALSFPALNLCRTERLSKRADRRSSVAPFPPATENPVFFPFSITGPDRWKNRQVSVCMLPAVPANHVAMQLVWQQDSSGPLPFHWLYRQNFCNISTCFPCAHAKKEPFGSFFAYGSNIPIPKTTGSPACGRYPTGSACAIGYFSA